MLNKKLNIITSDYCLFHIHLLGTYYLPGIHLDPGETTVSRRKKDRDYPHEQSPFNPTVTFRHHLYFPWICPKWSLDWFSYQNRSPPEGFAVHNQETYSFSSVFCLFISSVQLPNEKRFAMSLKSVTSILMTLTGWVFWCPFWKEANLLVGFKGIGCFQQSSEVQHIVTAVSAIDHLWAKRHHLSKSDFPICRMGQR